MLAIQPWQRSDLVRLRWTCGPRFGLALVSRAWSAGPQPAAEMTRTCRFSSRGQTHWQPLCTHYWDAWVVSPSSRRLWQ